MSIDGEHRRCRLVSALLRRSACAATIVVGCLFHINRALPCGMGVCQECRVTINGLRRLACQTLCQAGMRIERSDDE
ncbi:(2Fe-2S)-binding protein [Serratia ureilytica]